MFQMTVASWSAGAAAGEADWLESVFVGFMAKQTVSLLQSHLLLSLCVHVCVCLPNSCNELYDIEWKQIWKQLWRFVQLVVKP